MAGAGLVAHSDAHVKNVVRGYSSSIYCNKTKNFIIQ